MKVIKLWKMTEAKGTQVFEEFSSFVDEKLIFK
jgi:hypothetical protein